MILRLARLFLALALVAGWQASLLHPLEHRDAHGALVHAHGAGAAALEAGPADAPAPEDSTAGLCEVLAALGACVVAFAPAAPGALAVAPVSLLRAGARPGLRTRHAYRAQAPPSLS